MMLQFLLIAISYLQPQLLQEQKYQLKLEVTDIHSDEGRLEVAVYIPSDDFPEKDSYKRFKVSAKQPSTIVRMELPAGIYAIAVFHDKNLSGDLDKNFVGIPKEPVGMSNGKGHGLSRPDFRDASFKLQRDTSFSLDLVHY